MKIIKQGHGPVIELEEGTLKDLRSGKTYTFEGNKVLDEGGNVVYQFVRFSMLDAEGRLVLERVNSTAFLIPGKGVVAETRGNSLYAYDGSVYDLEGLWFGPKIMAAVGLLFL